MGGLHGCRMYSVACVTFCETDRRCLGSDRAPGGVKSVLVNLGFRITDVVQEFYEPP